MKLRIVLSAAVAAAALAGVPIAPPSAASGERPSEARSCTHALTSTGVRLQSLDLVGVGECPGVRPGAYLITSIGGCTFNFLFTGGDGRRYAGTAGHCALEKDHTEQVWASGNGPAVEDSQRQVIGRFVYAVLDDPKDFAVIELLAGVDASPQMCHFGGPTGLYTDQSSSAVELHHFGNGIALGDTVPGRSAVALNTLNPNYVSAMGAAIFGDSGSGVITDDGRAVGVLVSLDFNPFGYIGITRLPPQLKRASEKLGTTLTLQTAPKLP
jgi:hypothetical protein